MGICVTYFDSLINTRIRECWPNERTARERYEALIKTAFAQDVQVLTRDPNTSTYANAS